jgi:hypothetical protein
MRKTLPNSSWAAGKRRIYKPEVFAATGWAETWLRQQIANGNWPAPRVDPGGKRQFWIEDEARAALDRINQRAVVKA